MRGELISGGPTKEEGIIVIEKEKEEILEQKHT